ncbi:hypothetical protein ACFVUS_26640 [Nocardia sp. NPDC058058]|uniref:hypothetical protein n=1 Tax=Nocardia sp. NPDC058058 TaxID=3346317 RepID=UPI0036D7E8B5
MTIDEPAPNLSITVPAVEIGNRYESYEIELWERLAGLLPSVEDAANFRDCREIGEQEAGLWLLTQRLLDHGVPVDDRTRAEIEVLAEHWGERYARHDEIASCVGDPAPEVSIRLVPDDRAEAIEAAITDAVFAGRILVPWIECPRCGRVLSRVHSKQPWGGLSAAAEHYILSLGQPNLDDARQIFDRDDLYRAWESLIACD